MCWASSVEPYGSGLCSCHTRWWCSQSGYSLWCTCRNCRESSHPCWASTACGGRRAAVWPSSWWSSFFYIFKPRKTHWGIRPSFTMVPRVQWRVNTNKNKINMHIYKIIQEYKGKGHKQPFWRFNKILWLSQLTVTITTGEVSCTWDKIREFP